MKSIKWLIPLILFGTLLSFPTTGQENKPTMVPDELPIFPGGEEALRTYITDNIQYPAEAKEKGIEGKVFVTYTIGKDGKVKDAKVARGVQPLLDNEALRVVENMPEWEPGSKKGIPMEVQLTIPVSFKLAPKIKE